MKIYYSASEQGFYIAGVNQQIPDDVKEIEQSLYEQLLQDNHKLGMWIDYSSNPPRSREVIKTSEQLSAEALQKKETLIELAREKISIWQTQLLLNIISDDDKASLTEWMIYLKNVQAVDVSLAPSIDWPEAPGLASS